ncbi:MULTISPECIES: hypothetical protein [unclassified Nonomuraea]
MADGIEEPRLRYRPPALNPWPRSQTSRGTGQELAAGLYLIDGGPRIGRQGGDEGLAAAQARRQRLGRPPTMTDEQIRHARDLRTRPANTLSSIARLLGPDGFSRTGPGFEILAPDERGLPPADGNW